MQNLFDTEETGWIRSQVGIKYQPSDGGGAAGSGAGHGLGHGGMTHTRTIVGHPARLSGFSSRLPAVSNDTSRRRAELEDRWERSAGGSPGNEHACIVGL